MPMQEPKLTAEKAKRLIAWTVLAASFALLAWIAVLAR